MLIGRASFQCIVASRNELWSTHKKRSLEAIQVDGGSEFKAEFEAACQAKAIRGYELPPKRPQLNGAVERCSGA